MKNLLIVLVLGLTFSNATYADSEGCRSIAESAAENSFYDQLNSIPGATSVNGIELLGQSSDESTFTGRYYTLNRNAFSYSMEVKIHVKQGFNCRVETVTVKEKVLNITSPQEDTSFGNACMFEMGLVCDKGEVDRCNVYPEAEFHGCVPDLRE